MMKFVNYRLQTQMEQVKQDATHFLKEYLQNILEDKNRAYYQKGRNEKNERLSYNFSLY